MGARAGGRSTTSSRGWGNRLDLHSHAPSTSAPSSGRRTARRRDVTEASLLPRSLGAAAAAPHGEVLQLQLGAAGVLRLEADLRLHLDGHLREQLEDLVAQPVRLEEAADLLGDDAAHL